MNEIIVGIDFSDCSLNALEHAAVVAQKTSRNILMVFVNNPNRSTNLVSGNVDIIAEAKEKLDELAKTYQKKYSGVMISFNIREGKVFDRICAQAEESEAYMIVVGTHGASGFEEFWIGSNAQKIVSMTPCPILTIRHSRQIHNELKIIVFPVDSTLETRQKAPFTGEIAIAFDATIHILKLYSTSVDAVRATVDAYARQVKEYFDSMEIKNILIEKEADNITNTTLEYAREAGANLISIMTEQEKTAMNWFLGTYANQMINHSEMPVLSIRPKEYIRTLSR
ncbi:MAG: universal stress protein [Bacteroidales bacterium]|nr:universal stress protein [Bacteroidales bacterium]MDD3961679.1 universal stress protein [Bacteroidales bacterium]MDY0286165.1 universal stress protein [Bacteroidales bacterium]HPE87649.1 universal stress protein [Bacteroidales bacterium]